MTEQAKTVRKSNHYHTLKLQLLILHGILLYDLYLHYRGLLTRGVAPPAACRSMDDEELFLLLLLLLSLTRRSGVGVYDIRRADPNESFDRALLMNEPFLEG